MHQITKGDEHAEQYQIQFNKTIQKKDGDQSQPDQDRDIKNQTI